MSPAESAVRARRKLTNKLIAAHEAHRLRPFMTAEVTLIAGDGGVILGAEAVIEAFAAQFADPSFDTFERTTETVEVDAAGARAAERGAWRALHRGEAAPRSAGAYLAVWRKITGQWMIESELYVTLT